MSPDQRAALQSELTDLQRKASKRRDQAGYAANVKAIEARIVAVQAELAIG